MDGLINWPVAALQVLVLLGLSVFWIWALVDCIRNARPGTRASWSLVILLTHALGALLYVAFGRRRRADGGFAQGL